MAANNMSNIHVSLDVPSTLMLLQQGKLNKLQQQILHGISRGSRPRVLYEKTALKLRPATLLKRDCNAGVFL